RTRRVRRRMKPQSHRPRPVQRRLGPLGVSIVKFTRNVTDRARWLGGDGQINGIVAGPHESQLKFHEALAPFRNFGMETPPALVRTSSQSRFGRIRNLLSCRRPQLTERCASRAESIAESHAAVTAASLISLPENTAS